MIHHSIRRKPYDSMAKETTRLQASASKSPKVSIIILNTNGLPYLQRCLDSVLGSDYPDFEVVFVDNASRDGSVEFVEYTYGKDARLRIVCNNTNTNLGYAKGNNVGASLAKGDYLVFLNEDTEVERNWLKELMKVAIQDYNIAACQSKLLLMEDKKTLDVIGSYLTPLGFLYHEGHLEEDRTQTSEIKEIFSAKGACLLVRREVFEKVGRFDEDFFMFFEESDLCWRIWLSGYKILYVPNSLVYHRGSLDRIISADKTRMGTYYGFRNRIYSLVANLDTSNLVRILPVHLILCLGLSTWFVIGGGWRGKRLEAFNILRAIVDCAFSVRFLIRKRKLVQYKIRRVPDKILMPKIMKKVGLIYFSHLLGNYMRLIQAR